MKMSERLDDGDMLGFSFVDIRDETADEIFKALGKVAAKFNT